MTLSGHAPIHYRTDQAVGRAYGLVGIDMSIGNDLEGEGEERPESD